MREAMQLLDMLAEWPSGSPGSPAWLELATAARDAYEAIGTALVALEDQASAFVREVGRALLARPRNDDASGGPYVRYMVICSRPAKADALQQVLAHGPALPGELAAFAVSDDRFWSAVGEAGLQLRSGRAA